MAGPDGQCSQKLLIELFLNSHALHLQHADAFLSVPLVNFFIHRLFLDNILADTQALSGALPVQHGRTIGRS